MMRASENMNGTSMEPVSAHWSQVATMAILARRKLSIFLRLQPPCLRDWTAMRYVGNVLSRDYGIIDEV
jgi:hypothetical protein